MANESREKTLGLAVAALSLIFIPMLGIALSAGMGKIDTRRLESRRERIRREMGVK